MIHFYSFFLLFSSTVVSLFSAPLLAAENPTPIERLEYQSGNRTLHIEVLRDDLIHFEYLDASSKSSAASWVIPSTSLVYKTDYPGPTEIKNSVREIETKTTRILISADQLCMKILKKNSETVTLCPNAKKSGSSGLSIQSGAPAAEMNLYGLGEQFNVAGGQNGDWTGKQRLPGNSYGNAMVGYNGGAVGNAQFPVLYAVGTRPEQSFSVFVDSVAALSWDFRTSPWQVSSASSAYKEPMRGYILLADRPLELRRQYVELTGLPPVPPKKMFGLWVSQYGFSNWGELDSKLKTLREHHFPLDGFVLDLQWFGGVKEKSDLSPMGGLNWDFKNFPKPAEKIEALARDSGVGITLIEESYVSKGLPEHQILEAKGYLAREKAGGPATYITYNPWWGQGGLIDWTNGEGSAFWHDWKRQPLIDLGIVAHWTDLGEPEMYNEWAWYSGLPGLDRHQHADVHNLMNFKWSESIAGGYARHHVERRPFILSRSGTSGIQRFGVAMWSGDIGSNLSSLAAHLNAEMHMSMSGVDYFGSDIGGFHRESLDGDLNEMYTQWFADSAAIDVPIRAHTENLCKCKETAPDRIGDVKSNLANLRTRYELAPYYYSLAHHAHLSGDPVMSPLFLRFPDDLTARQMGDEKMIGPSLLVATVAKREQKTRDVYLPLGDWFDYRSDVPFKSQGEWLRGIPLYTNGLFKLPLFVRSGSILPKMQVDDLTLNILGKRLDGSLKNELKLQVYPNPQESSFKLYEDDGQTIDYQKGKLAQTQISQKTVGSTIFVTVEGTQGNYTGMKLLRDTQVDIVSQNLAAHSKAPHILVRLNGFPLKGAQSFKEFNELASAWIQVGPYKLKIKSGILNVREVKRFEINGF